MDCFSLEKHINYLGTHARIGEMVCLKKSLQIQKKNLIREEEEEIGRFETWSDRPT